MNYYEKTAWSQGINLKGDKVMNNYLINCVLLFLATLIQITTPFICTVPNFEAGEGKFLHHRGGAQSGPISKTSLKSSEDEQETSEPYTYTSIQGFEVTRPRKPSSKVM
jgi:hypothetical protein